MFHLKIRFALAALFCFCSFSVLAQLTEKRIEEHLHTANYAVDSDAKAIVLFERTDIEIAFDGVNATQTMAVHRTIKIRNRDAADQANIHLVLPAGSSSVHKIKGVTYNLVAGKINKTELPDEDHFKNRILKGLDEVSFTMPDVREGSVIDYSFIINSPVHYVLPVWHIQDDLPKLITEYSVSYPEQLSFAYLMHIRIPVKDFSKEQDAINASYAFCHYESKVYFNKGAKYLFWTRKNIPALKDEPFVINISAQKESLQLLLVQDKAISKIPFMDTWDKYNKAVWEDDIALNIRRANNFLSDAVNTAIKNENGKLAKAKAIFNYVRSEFKENNIIVSGTDMRDVFNKKEGSADQINELLSAMMNKAGIEAYMLMTGTTASLPAIATYPMPNLLNHVVCAIVIDSAYIPLDASDKNNAFGILPVRFYNGYARVISKEGDAIVLTRDLLENNNTYTVNIKYPTDSTRVVKISEKIGMISSIDLRKELDKDKKEFDAFFEKYVSKIDDNAEIIEKKIENLVSPDTNLIIKVTYKIKTDIRNDKYFFNTSYIRALDGNPFVAATRQHPIELPFRSNDNYYITVALPTGYTPDMIPRPSIITFEDSNMRYSKHIEQYAEMNTLAINISLKNNRTEYEMEAYDLIREFYKNIIEEENKIIEFKKEK